MGMPMTSPSAPTRARTSLRSGGRQQLFREGQARGGGGCGADDQPGGHSAGRGATRKAGAACAVRSGGITAIWPKHFCRQVCAHPALSSQQPESGALPLQ